MPKNDLNKLISDYKYFFSKKNIFPIIKCQASCELVV